jgi:hypothetical protein
METEPKGANSEAPDVTTGLGVELVVVVLDEVVALEEAELDTVDMVVDTDDVVVGAEVDEEPEALLEVELADDVRVNWPERTFWQKASLSGRTSLMATACVQAWMTHAEASPDTSCWLASLHWQA